MDMRRCLIGLTVLMFVLCAIVYVRAADEIKLDLNVRVEKDVLAWEQKPGRIEVDMSGDSISDITQSFAQNATSVVTIAAGVATNGYVWMRNVTTNTAFYIEVGPTNGATFVPMIRLNAQELAIFRLLPVLNLSGRATGGAVNLRTAVFED